jgi:hypothetical protein
MPRNIILSFIAEVMNSTLSFLARSLEKRSTKPPLSEIIVSSSAANYQQEGCHVSAQELISF